MTSDPSGFVIFIPRTVPSAAKYSSIAASPEKEEAQSGPRE